MKLAISHPVACKLLILLNGCGFVLTVALNSKRTKENKGLSVVSDSLR